jgi:hypothetical protein
LEQRTLNIAATQQEGGKHEEDAFEHCLGSSGIVCVGADHAAAAYENSGRAASADHYHDDVHY